MPARHATSTNAMVGRHVQTQGTGVRPRALLEPTQIRDIIGVIEGVNVVGADTHLDAMGAGHGPCQGSSGIVHGRIMR